MGDFVGTAASGICLLTSAATAPVQENPVLAAVTIGINAAFLIANAGIEIYRKIRDRDKDLTQRQDKNENDKTEG